jgi:RimJ/RimL family protein N-acetyltransferase
MVVTRGERVVLRPFRSEEADEWHRARMASAGDRTQFPVGPPDPDRLRERVERSAELREGGLDLAIEVDGRLIGEIGTYAEPGRTMWPGLYFSPSLSSVRRTEAGLGTEAVRALCDWLFGSAGAERIESSTAVSNARMRGVFDKLRFGFDGVKRRWDVDRAHYSVSREQWNVDRS